MFIFAFNVGAWITGYSSGDGAPFEASFEGVAAVFGEIWYPLLVGCFVCGISAGAVGSLLVRWSWRFYLVYLRRKRRRRDRDNQRAQ